MPEYRAKYTHSTKDAFQLRNGGGINEESTLIFNADNDEEAKKQVILKEGLSNIYVNWTCTSLERVKLIPVPIR